MPESERMAILSVAQRIVLNDCEVPCQFPEIAFGSAMGLNAPYAADWCLRHGNKSTSNARSPNFRYQPIYLSKENYLTEKAIAQATDELADTVIVPDDFPRDPFPAAVPGAQPKFSARLIDGKYVVGLTKEERAERFLACTDLVDQLKQYFHRKQSEGSDLSVDALLNKIDVGIRHKGWDFGEVEFAWIMQRLRAQIQTEAAKTPMPPEQ